MAKKLQTPKNESIPPLKEWMQLKASKARSDAAAHIIKQQAPNVPVVPSRNPVSLMAGILGMSDADRIKYFGTGDPWTCIYTVTSQFNDRGALVPGNITFRNNPARFGFSEIPIDSAQVGDLIQFTSNRPHPSIITQFFIILGYLFIHFLLPKALF